MNYRPEIRDLDDDDLRTIAQEFGIDVAMRMRKIFGGRRIYIAKCPSKAEIRSFIGKHPRLVRSEILNALGISETTYYNAISGMMDFSERNTEESSHDKP